MRLENGLPEPWEKDEQRYEWNAPVDSLSELKEEDAPPDMDRCMDTEEVTNVTSPGSHAGAPLAHAALPRKRNG